MPTISDKSVIPFENPIILLKISPRLNPPNARSSSGETLCNLFKAAFIFFSTETTSASSYAAIVNHITSSPVLYSLLNVSNGIKISPSVSNPPPGINL